MSRKIRLTGLGIVVAILIAGLIAICVVSSGNVGKVNVSKSYTVTQSSIELKWKSIGSAEGYNIYQKMSDNDEDYQQVATVEGKKTLEYKIENLQDATKYSFCVKAYKNSGENLVESAKFDDINICTLPSTQNVKLSPSGEGAIRAILEENDRANGYEINYSTSDNFDDFESVKIDDITAFSQEVSGLEVDTEYFFRARSYVDFDGETLYGEWSDTASETAIEKASSDIDPTKPMIAFTFDDGPSYNNSSEMILDTIEKYGVKATFFMVGTNAENLSDNVKRKAELGCELGNHTYTHKNYGKNITASDISNATEAISNAAGGAKVTCFRCPGGIITSTIQNECVKEGLPLFYWSIDTKDWDTRDTQKIYDSVMNNVKDGDIILMHEIYESSAEAFEKMVPELLSQGYQLVTCSELVEAKTGKAPEPGQQYVNGTKINNQTS